MIFNSIKKNYFNIINIYTHSMWRGSDTSIVSGELGSE